MTTLVAVLDVLASLTIIILSITLAYSFYIDSKKKKATAHFLDAIHTIIERENRPDT